MSDIPPGGRAESHLGQHRLDPFDLRILALLSDKGRMSWSDLAQEIGLSQTPTLRRVRALEGDGFIAGYRAIIDETKIGSGISVFVSVSLEKQTDESLARFETCVKEIAAAMDCYMMSGTPDFLLRAVLPDLTTFQSFISYLTRIPGVSRISSSFAVKSVLQRSAPPLPRGRDRGEQRSA